MTNNTDTTAAREAVARVLAATDPTLGMSADEAREMADLIYRADLGTNDALRAYDELHARATSGRAW